jgi:uncharacterized membrane protein
MQVANAGESVGFTLVARRNNSLSSAGRTLVVGSLAAISLVISLAFAVRGAWMIMPFAGLEVLLVYLAFRCLEQHAGDFESLSIQDDRVLIVRRERGEVSRHEFNRYWAQVVLQPSRWGRHVVLALRSHGRQVEFGRHLTEEQRCKMAGIIRTELGNRQYAKSVSGGKGT